MNSNNFLLLYCVIGGFIIFAPIVGLVFPEFALFYKLYGNSGHPSISFILNSFFNFSGGWYRPVSFGLAPFLLGIDFTNPSSVVVFNIVFLSITIFLATTIFLENSKFAAKVLAASFIISAPALQSVSYFPVIDSLYIIFGIANIFTLEKAFNSNSSVVSKDYFFAFLFLLLSISSKEIGILAPLVAPFVILLRQVGSPNQLISWNIVRAVFLHCLPLIAFSFIFYAVYIYNKGISISASNYSTFPVFTHFGKIKQFIEASLNIAYPASSNFWLRWSTSGYDPIDTNIRIGLYTTTLIIMFYALIKHQFKPIIIFAGLLTCLTIPLGLFHIHPHHTYPVIMTIAIGITASISWFDEILSSENSFTRRTFSKALYVILSALSIVLMYRAYVYNSNILNKGIHKFELRYNTSLFNDTFFEELIQKRLTYLLVEECPNSWAVASNAGIIPYYARTTNFLGESYVPRGSIFVGSFDKYAEIKKIGAQLIGLECHPESFPPYKIINFSELNLD